jgi:hypothetical protein
VIHVERFIINKTLVSSAQAIFKATQKSTIMAKFLELLKKFWNSQWNKLLSWIIDDTWKMKTKHTMEKTNDKKNLLFKRKTFNLILPARRRGRGETQRASRCPGAPWRRACSSRAAHPTRGSCQPKMARDNYLIENIPGANPINGPASQ